MELQQFLDAAREHIHPDIKIRYKEEEGWWRKLLPKTYKDSWTTMGTDIWAPTRDRVEDPLWITSTVAVFLHECGHVEDRHQGAVGFYGRYTAPQIMSALLAAIVIAAEFVFGFPFHWAIPLSIVFVFPLLPWPSPLRVGLEQNPYAIGTWIRIRQYLNMNDATLRAEAEASLSKALRGWLYYKMVWRKKTADRLAREIFNEAVKWCMEEAIGATPQPFRNAQFNNTVVELLDKPRRRIWRPAE